ncbi:type II toxin-antitoxin system Phd/YefM family antitoxin [Actinomadura yumaensis]|uniref:Type II toxin-antitoxin system Phd/YefM family antitoxin n=1 Tax=Actinomadura yumaensis TaxID=111807 RepID=A0ABW2CQH0_9ACTN
MKIAVKALKSRTLRDTLSEAMRFVESGGEIVIEHYRRVVARLVPADGSVVVLHTPNAAQGERLRRLVDEHGALGIPFPNNIAAGWRVVDERGEPVNPHAIPSVAVSVAAVGYPETDLTVTLYETNGPSLVLARGDDAWDLGAPDGHYLNGTFAADAQAWHEGTWEPNVDDGQEPTLLEDDLTPVAQWTSEGVTLLTDPHRLGVAALYLGTDAPK